MAYRRLSANLRTLLTLVALIAAGGQALAEAIGVPGALAGVGSFALVTMLLAAWRRRRQSSPATRPCRDCGAPIAFARTESSWMPLDVSPVGPEAPLPARAYRVDWNRHMPRAVPENDPARRNPVYVMHFVTCPSRGRRGLRFGRSRAS
jgi:hypothetical protein